ncbi:MAG: hypothetical protein KKI08_08335 [Armatimonadetes bacterium]|nr:hypothetical protein [Armatimonadota bacterium]
MLPKWTGMPVGTQWAEERLEKLELSYTLHIQNLEERLNELEAFHASHRLSRRLVRQSIGLTAGMAACLLFYFLFGKIIVAPEWAVAGLGFAAFLRAMGWAAAKEE